MGAKDVKLLRPLWVLVALTLIGLGYMLSHPALLGQPTSTTIAIPKPGAAVGCGVTCPACPIATSVTHLDASTKNIEYFLALWNKWLASQVKGYNPGAHGITEPKYKGQKVQFFYNEMLEVSIPLAAARLALSLGFG
jgi:hypothetical protein